jgi:hypothetical protein
MQLAPTISDETRGSSRMRCRSRCSRRPQSREPITRLMSRRERGAARGATGAASASTLAGGEVRAGQAGAPRRASNPYFGSTPPEAYFRPDRRTSRPARAAAVKDGRHIDGEACSPLPRPLLDGLRARRLTAAARGMKVPHALSLATPIVAKGGGGCSASLRSGSPVRDRRASAKRRVRALRARRP